jgi:hypothetical protein
MPRLILVLVLICGAASAGAQANDPANFSEEFSFPDGSIPPDWTWTADPLGEGQFAVQDSQFVHLSGGSSYYVRVSPEDSMCYQGWYRFDVKDSDWEFAWGVHGTAQSGSCCRLYHNDAWGQPGFTMTYSEWSVPPEYPDGQYMFHNSTDLFIAHSWTEPLVGWHHVEIEDILGFLRITVDDSQVIFDQSSFNGGGHVGLGAIAGGEMTPAFDNVEHVAYHSPVEQTSWGRMKAMFR